MPLQEIVENKYYVYALVDPINRVPFYIGKGKVGCQIAWNKGKVGCQIAWNKGLKVPSISARQLGVIRGQYRSRKSPVL